MVSLKKIWLGLNQRMGIMILQDIRGLYMLVHIISLIEKSFQNIRITTIWLRFFNWIAKLDITMFNLKVYIRCILFVGWLIMNLKIFWVLHFNCNLELLFCAFRRLGPTSLLKPEQLIVSREQELTSLSGFKYTRVCPKQSISMSLVITASVS